MLYELETIPFYEPNTLAMLNTFYPPCSEELPNGLIEPNKLQKQLLVHGG